MLRAEDVYDELMGALNRGAEQEFRAALYKALACQANSAKAYCDLANILGHVEFFSGAISLYQKALNLDPNYCYARNGLAKLLQKQGSFQQALNEYKEAFRRDPSDITALWGELLFLPTLYETEVEMQFWRKTWRHNLEQLQEMLQLNSPQEIDRAMEALLFHTNFLLAYQGDDILNDQMLYGELISRIAKAKYPQYHSLRPKRNLAPGEKIRVGFVSTFLFNHSIFKTHGQWITKLDKSRFEVYTFYLSDIEDSASRQIKSHSDFFFKNSGHDEGLIAKIAGCDLDVLIYFDIGMRPFVQLLAALRLAPIQCNALGHPVSSGIPCIDFMLSSALMEPDDGDAHYMEKLVRLPNLSSSYPEPQVEKAIRLPGLKEKDPGKVVYLNVQNLLKLLPQHDSLYPQLALRVPQAEFHFIGTSREVTFQLFYRRLQRAFSAYGLDVSKYCVFHPNLSTEQFFGLLRYGDVVLDSLDWSGFNSTMEALACDKPAVTCPGSTCRSRHSYAILTMLGMPELIAHDVEEYLAIGAALSDPVKRKLAVEKIQANKKRLFEDQTAIQGLEHFLEEAVKS